MDFRGWLKETFKKDIFTKLKEKEIEAERIRVEKRVEAISDEIKNIQEKIRTLMLEAKGQTNTMKMLNIQKIKALRLQSSTKQDEAMRLLKEQQLLLLLEAMKEHEEDEQKSHLIDQILDSDTENLTKTIFNEDVQKAMEEGRIETVKSKLKRVFSKDEIPTDDETHEILKTIDDLERVDEETAFRMAKERSKQMAELPLRKKQEEDEED